MVGTASRGEHCRDASRAAGELGHNGSGRDGEEVQQLAEQREQRKKGDGETARASTTDPIPFGTRIAASGPA